jgi:hypothetical protein
MDRARESLRFVRKPSCCGAETVMTPNAFLAFLKSLEATAVIERCGYGK